MAVPTDPRDGGATAARNYSKTTALPPAMPPCHLYGAILGVFILTPSKRTDKAKSPFLYTIRTDQLRPVAPHTVVIPDLIGSHWFVFQPPHCALVVPSHPSNNSGRLSGTEEKPFRPFRPFRQPCAPFACRSRLALARHSCFLYAD